MRRNSQCEGSKAGEACHDVRKEQHESHCDLSIVSAE